MKNTFRDWLMQFKDEQSPYGDAVRDTLADEWQRGKQVQSCRELRLWASHGCSEAIETVEELIKQYKTHNSQ